MRKYIAVFDENSDTISMHLEDWRYLEVLAWGELCQPQGLNSPKENDL